MAQHAAVRLVPSAMKQTIGSCFTSIDLPHRTLGTQDLEVGAVGLGSVAVRERPHLTNV
ncbi:hypothetical protein ABZ471_34210 [Streptomyces sp. NPDC005728]|uniref:hypothetical protein n=1 Tax=Streptomyces sp. NPDC005728 TaxID=3157054 RepID=UPI0033F9618F